MRSGARIGITLGLLVATGAGCAALAGIEDLQLTGGADAALDVNGVTGDATADSGGSSSGSGSGGGDTGAEGGGVEAGPCVTGDVRCAGNAVETCANGQWGAPATCTGQTCVGGACTGTCAPGQTNPVPCSQCGTDTQTCSGSGAWQASGTCSGQGACAPNATEACNTYGTQACTAACAWGACSCASAAVCTPGATQCSGTQVQTCGGCGQWGLPTACPSGTCVGGVCTGTCSPGQKQCSGNGVQTCSGGGQWGSPVACTNQTCVLGACTGACAPGQTDPVACGKCGTDTQTCDTSGAWKTSGTCAGQGACSPNATQTCNTYGSETCSASCAWGSCSCGSTPVCTPGTKQCSGTGVQTCSACGQWGNPVSCGPGMTCTGSGTCVVAPTDCPGSYIVCDGFETNGSINAPWSPSSDPNVTIGVDTSGSHAHRGTNSLHLHVNAFGSSTYFSNFVAETAPATLGSARFYVRLWVWMSNYPGVDNVGLMTLLSHAAGDSASGGFGIDKFGAYGDGVTNTAGHAQDWEGNSQVTLPTSTWTCVKVLVDTTYAAPNPNGVLQVWDDGGTGPDPLLSGPDNLAALKAVWFGIDGTGPISSAVDLYFDDIAIGTQYIDCND